MVKFNFSKSIVFLLIHIQSMHVHVTVYPKVSGLSQ